jgi:hypothetical protein
LRSRGAYGYEEDEILGESPLVHHIWWDISPLLEGKRTFLTYLTSQKTLGVYVKLSFIITKLRSNDS